MDKADQYLNRLQHLPPAPTVAVQLLDLLADPNQRVDRFVELVRHDPALTAKIMQRCNRACFSTTEPASDMFEVVLRLGFYEVYCVVATALGSDLMSLGQAHTDPNLTRLWRHSVMTAVAAGELAKRVEAPTGVAFTAGLLHDLGKQVFAVAETTKYVQLMALNGASGLNLVEQEQEFFGVNHAVIGARLLRRWGLPESIAQATERHHDAAGDGTALGAVIQLANRLAHHLADAAPAVGEIPALPSHSTELLGLTAHDLPPLLTQIQFGLQRVEGFSR